MRNFTTGAVRDDETGKERYIDSISWLTLKRFAKYMTKTAEKYGSGNWRKGIPIEAYEESLIRHLQKYLSNKYEGTNIEPDTDHLAGVFFNLQGIMHEEEKVYNSIHNNKE